MVTFPIFVRGVDLSVYKHVFSEKRRWNDFEVGLRTEGGGKGLRRKA
jgi:hypothetical protein